MATATVKYFSADGIELSAPMGMKNAQFEALFPAVKAKRFDSFARLVGFAPGARWTPAMDQATPVVRIIEFKKNPSLHKCDGRCLHAKGRTCECSCGGKNHGAGG